MLLPFRRRAALPTLLTCVLVFGISAGASATFIHIPSLPGISLEELIEDEGEITSENEMLMFSNFEADVSGLALPDLDFYRVVPLEDGIRFITPLFVFAGFYAVLGISFDVMAAEGKIIESAWLSMSSGVLGNGTASVDETVTDPEGRVIAELETLEGGPFHHGTTTDHALLGDAFDKISVEKLIGVSSATGHGWAWGSGHHVHHAPGLAKVLIVEQRFGGASRPPSVPEPSAAALLPIGLLGLWYFGLRSRLERARAQAPKGSPRVMVSSRPGPMEISSTGTSASASTRST